MSYNILCIRSYIFILDYKSILITPLFFRKLGFLDNYSRLTGIISRFISNLTSDCETRSNNCIREVSLNEVIDLRANCYSILTIHVEVIHGEFICINALENCNCIKRFSDSCARFNFCSSIFVFPVIKCFSCDERVFGHSCNLIANVQIHKILRFLTNNISRIIFDKERNTDVPFKKCIQRQVTAYSGRSSILCTLSVRFCIPTFKCRSGLDRIRGKNDRRSRSCGHFLILRIIHHELHSKNVLFIVSIYREITGDNRSHCKLICSTGVYPFPDLIRFRSYCRKFIYSKTCINIG